MIVSYMSKNISKDIYRKIGCQGELLGRVEHAPGGDTLAEGARVNHSRATFTTFANRSKVSLSGAWIPERHWLTVAGDTPTNDNPDSLMDCSL